MHNTQNFTSFSMENVPFVLILFFQQKFSTIITSNRQRASILNIVDVQFAFAARLAFFGIERESDIISFSLAAEKSNDIGKSGKGEEQKKREKISDFCFLFCVWLCWQFREQFYKKLH